MEGMEVVGWELLRCERCGYDHVRRQAGRHALPCTHCCGRMVAHQLAIVAEHGAMPLRLPVVSR